MAELGIVMLFVVGMALAVCEMFLPGVVLGLVLSYTAIRDIRAEEAEENLRWVVPWFQIGVIVTVTYVFSLLGTYLPARQASRIYPAEALRYE